MWRFRRGEKDPHPNSVSSDKDQLISQPSTWHHRATKVALNSTQSWWQLGIICLGGWHSGRLATPCFSSLSSQRAERRRKPMRQPACSRCRAGPFLPPLTVNFRLLSVALIFPPGLVEPEEGPPFTASAQLSWTSFFSGLWHFPFLFL